MKITLVRHAEVEERYQGCYNGHIDIGLSIEGERQADALHRHFERSSFDAVYCSDLRRAVDTLKCITCEPILTPELREKSWGRHEGLRYAQITAMEQKEYEDFLQWISVLDGEPLESFLKRIEAFFINLMERPCNRVLIVTHGGVIKAFQHLFFNVGLEEAFGLNIPYASIHEYELH